MDDVKSEQGFQIKFAYVAWVPPLRIKKDGRGVQSRVLDTENKAFGYFLNIFEKAVNDCTIEIQFKSPKLNQSNEVRTYLLKIVNSKSEKIKEKSALALSQRLADVTDERSGIGLFLLIIGEKLQTTRILLSRFRSDEVIFTRHTKQKLIVDFYEEAFNKKSHYYKSAVFEDTPSADAFWRCVRVFSKKNKRIQSCA